MKYKVQIVKLGNMAKELIDNGMMVIFNENAPPELAEISVLHTSDTLCEDVVTGDHVRIGDMEYVVKSVGWEVNKTLRELGHCTLKFDNSKEKDLPGVVLLDNKEIPNIKIGDEIVIY